MKVNFAICDDSVVDSNYVKELVTQWGNDKKYQVNIDIFSSAEAFIFHYVENKEYDVLLLDIEMENMDGVTLARQIRKSNKSVQIVFITGYSDYIAEGYDVEALHYLMKPLKKEKLYDVLDRAVNKIMQNEKHLVLNTFDEMISAKVFDGKSLFEVWDTVTVEEIDGCEPMERLVVDVPSDAVGAVIEKLGSRKGDLVEMNPVGSRMKIEFLIPSRGLFGYRNEFLTDTKGEGIMASVFDSYAPYRGELSRRNTGSLVSFETGESVAYGLFNAQERGSLFIGPGTPVYAGMIVGETPKNEDISVNVCKKKQLTNMRASGSDEALRLTTPRTLSLEQCLEFLADDELLEVTPENLRLRKRLLDHSARMREASKKKS